LSRTAILYRALLRESYRIKPTQNDWDNPESEACVLHEELEKLNKELTEEERRQTRELAQALWREYRRPTA
jgi:hypothetical protein